MRITHDVTITLANGSPVTHTAELVALFHSGDGSCTAVAACCGKLGSIVACPSCGGASRGCSQCQGSGSIKDEDTRSADTFYDIAGMSQDEIVGHIQHHVERTANHHAGAHKARDFMGLLSLPDASPVTHPMKVG